MKLSNISLAVSAILLGASSSVWAEEQKLSEVEKRSTEQQQTKEEKVTEKITVTGSRLKRDSFSVATPLTIMDSEAISDTGIGELSEILTEGIPSLSMGLSNTTSQSSVSNTGISTVELRDLGSTRTLTLIDGRRVVSNSKSGNYVSMSTIPSGMVKSVEVITGGASATYGADAVSGVVNIITQTDKQGLEISAKAGATPEGGGEEFTLDLSYGNTFADDRGYIFFSANYEEQLGIKFTDRDRAQIQAAHSYSSSKMCNQMLTVDGWQCMRDTDQSQWASLSDGTFGGVFLESSKFSKQYWYDGQTLRDDWKGNEEKYGINSDQFVQLKVPSERVSAAVKVDFDVTDDITFYSQLQWSGNFTINDKSPEDVYESENAPYIDRETGEPGTVYLGYIPKDNPYIPAEILATMNERDDKYANRLYFDRRFAEVGPIYTDNDRQTIRGWAGLQGTMFDGEWDWDVSVGYGKFHQKQLRYNEFDIFKARNALDAERLDDGSVQCKSEAARAEGCVPLNLFGEGSITAEAADYIRVNPELNSYNEQTTVMGYIAGDLFDMPAGPVAAVFGAEYRHESQEAVTDDILTYGGITWNIIPGFKGEMNVAEVFAEASIPLIANVPGAEFLSLETSVRLSDYDIKNVDMVGSYKLGFLWNVGEGLNIRGNWAIAQRAPSINELYEPEAGDFDSYDDICDEVTATSDKPGHDSCRMIPAIAEAIAADPDFEFEDESSGYSPNSGNPDLNEEKGETYTLGFSYEPTFIDDFSIAVDYYDISITDAISTFDNERILHECYNSSIPFGQQNEFCDAITRDEDGQITKILQREYNLDELATRGYDVAIAYRLDLADLGDLKLKVDWNHLLEQSYTSSGIDGPEKVDTVGYVGNFDDKISASLAWSYEGLRIRWSTSYKSAALRSYSLQQDWEEDMADNAENCAAGNEDCIENPESLEFQNYDAYIKHNLSASYELELNDDSKLRVFGGVNNVFDDVGQFYIGSSRYGNSGPEYGAGVGRFVYLGAEVSF